MNSLTIFQKRVYKAVKKIPLGKVMTYKDVARQIGKPWAVRAVGRALNKNNFSSVPCHRVICSNGFVGGYNKGISKKLKILRQEGVLIDKNNKVTSIFIL